MNSLFWRQSPSHPPDSAPDSKRLTRRSIVFFDCVIFIHHDCFIFYVFVWRCFIPNTAYVSLGRLIQNNSLFVDKCSIYALASTLRVYCTKSTPEVILYSIFSTTNVWYFFYIFITNLFGIYLYLNTKNCTLSILLTATDQKPQKSLQKWYYPPSHHVKVNVMLSNVTF